jgi:hypothetical protein
MSEAGEWALNVGIVTEACWPFKGSIFDTCPSQPNDECALV